jgi:hypothetical protein
MDPKQYNRDDSFKVDDNLDEDSENIDHIPPNIIKLTITPKVTPRFILNTTPAGYKSTNSVSLPIDPNTCFIAIFNDGYSFRNLIEYLRGTNTEGYFRFGKESITYIQDDDSHIVLNELEIDGSNLLRYEFESSLDEYIVGVNIEQMRNITRSISKKEAIVMYKLKGDRLIYIRPRDQNNKITFINPIVMNTMTNYSVPTYTRNEKQPNCTIAASAFSKDCSDLIGLKCERAEIKGFPKGASMTGILPGGTSGRLIRYGDTVGNLNISTKIESELCSNPYNKGPILNIKTENTCSITIHNTVIKSLVRLNNLSASGIIKLYMEPGFPLKLLCNISHYGILRLYIREPNN